MFDLLSSIEYNQNITDRKKRRSDVKLDVMLRGITAKKNEFKLNADYSVIREITDEEYDRDIYRYIEPDFNLVEQNYVNSPRFIIFSAPGATGKTALAKHISKVTNALYWDLPKVVLGEYSFQGTIMKTVGVEQMSSFMGSLVEGNSCLVVDAFDEAETSSGRIAVEFFLRDFSDVTKECEKECAVLTTRTESSVLLKQYFKENNVPFIHYEVSYFNEDTAKAYIESKLEKKNICKSTVIDECMETQFQEIKRIFSEDEVGTFLGYAPVLDTLAETYGEERNTAILLKESGDGSIYGIYLRTILERLLEREQNDKFRPAVKARLEKEGALTNWKEMYSAREQLLRLFGLILFNDIESFLGNQLNLSPKQYDEYVEATHTLIKQHPFILPRESNSEITYTFAGPAFRDYVIAYMLADEDAAPFAESYVSETHSYRPSQMLIEMYYSFTKGVISGRHIQLMYDSYKAYSHAGDTAILSISGDAEECIVSFNSDSKGKSPMDFRLDNIKQGIYISRLTNCYIDVVGKVYIGDSANSTRINNTTIICDEVIWSSDNVLLEAYKPGNSRIEAQRFTYTGGTMPRFTTRCDEVRDLKISAQNLSVYYRLFSYRCDNEEQDDNSGYEQFAYTVRRILSCLRSHSKDTLARKIDFIDNRIISSSDEKRKVLDCLKQLGIIYTDEQDWLYKLDLEKLSNYGIIWNNLREGDSASLSDLYSSYRSK